jgi:hypothetical protein
MNRTAAARYIDPATRAARQAAALAAAEARQAEDVAAGRLIDCGKFVTDPHTARSLGYIA